MMAPLSDTSPTDPVALLLDALVWTLQDGTRADRFLALTGLDADQLRHYASSPATLRALAGFLADHEPDLVACADALQIAPTAIPAAARALGGAAHKDFDA